MPKPWNVNIHHDGKLDKCVPPRASSVLEVGCGDGFLAARLPKRIPHVVAVDTHRPVIERTMQRFPTAQVGWAHESSCSRWDASSSGGRHPQCPRT